MEAIICYMKAFTEAMEASIASVEASMAFVEAFMEAMEAAMEAVEASTEAFMNSHGSFHELPRKKQVVQETVACFVVFSYPIRQHPLVLH